MRITTVIIALLIGVSSIFSCKKSTTDVTPKAKSELLAGTVSKTWKNTKAEATNPSGLKIDLVITQPACVTDNLLTFFPNKSYEIREGATKCNAADADLLLKANWSLNAAETQFSIDKIIFQGREVDNVVFDIVELTETTFVGKTSIALSGSTYQFVATFEPAK
jgi:hypothetical protein